MAVVPWMTSNDLISSVKRKIMFPTSQSTFTNNDILAFANEEMMISQVPQILSVHEEYFVTYQVLPILANVSRYPMPTRSIGIKLRDVFWCDQVGGPTVANANLFDMSKVESEDKAYFQAGGSGGSTANKYYVEGNDVVLLPAITGTPSGSLVFYYYLRPNQLVTNDQAATIQSFSKQVTLNNASISNGDTFSITTGNTGTSPTTTTFTAVSGSPSTNQFQIGGSSIITAGNFATAITGSGLATASNGSPSSAVATLTYSDRTITVSTSNSAGFAFSSALGLNCDQVPTTVFSNGSLIDFLQTQPGHRTLGFGITIPTGGISGTTVYFTDTDVPQNIVVGDYFCIQHQCIIPQIPPDLHNGLAERTSGRILAALGDMQGVQTVNQRIQDIDKSEGILVDTRVSSQAPKILARHSLLRYGKMGPSRRS